jgi:WD40 repeat protein
MIRKVIASFLTLCIIGNLICSIPSASSQLVYNDVTYNDDSSSSSSYVAVNPDNTVIASAYSNDLILHNTTDFLEMVKIELQRNVQDLKFSPDGKFLAITISGTSELIDSVLVYDMENMEMKPEKQRVNSKRSSIDWTPDSKFIAVANFQNGVNLVNISSMDIVREYSNQHQDDVTCISFSNDGQSLITGDIGGDIKLWNFDGTFTGKSFQLSGEITGCGFNYLDQRISAVSSDGNITSWLKSGSLLHEKKITKANGMQWSSALDKLYIIEPGIAPRMIELDGSTFNEISSIYFIHKALDFDIHILSNGVVEDLYIATDTSHISNYARPELPEGYGQPGSDLDGDKVPDNIDDDDDGDSHLDEWDFNCVSEECQRNPDIEDIRNVNLEIDGDTLIIDDIFTFGLYESAKIRNLTRRSIISDQQISYEEANLFENSICQNIDSASIIDSWKDSVELSVGQVENGTLECIVTEGLVFSSTFDQTGVKLMFRMKFDIIPKVDLPLDLKVLEQVSFSDSTITHLAENHPIYVSHEIKNQKFEGNIWWKSEGTVTVNFEQVIDDEEVIDTLLGKISSNIYLIILGMILLIVALFMVIRRKNSISIELDDDDDEYNEDQEILEDYIDEITVSKPKPISHEQNILEQEEEVVQRDLSKPDESPTKRKTFSLDDDIEEVNIPKRRKVSSTNRNKQGPIMATKRKVLGGEVQTQKTKKVNIKSVKKGVRTRKVRVTKDDDLIE